jgi:membrane-associated protease RseP (regulator of RpoE activity)
MTPDMSSTDDSHRQPDSNRQSQSPETGNRSATTPDAPAQTLPEAATAVVDRDVIDLTAYPAPLLRLVPALDTDEPEAPAPKAFHPAVGLVVFLGIVAYCVAYGHLRTLLVVGALAFMITFHELGHYVAARATGMKATEFFVGFGPRLWSFRKGETEFGIKALPLGGYVKVIGMTNLEVVDPADEARTYRQATYPRRVLLASAGTLAHFLLAFILLVTLYTGVGTKKMISNLSVAQLNTLDSGRRPAADAGIALGDRVVAIDGEPTTVEAIGDRVQAANGKPIRMTIRRNGKDRVVSIVPELQSDGRQRIGVTWDSKVVTTKVGIGKGVSAAGSKIATLVPQTWSGLFKFFAPSNLKAYGKTLSKVASNQELTKAESEGRMSSAVGLTRLMTDASKTDIAIAIELFAIINIFVGMFNMLPLLPLDGGHVMVATYERLRSFRGRRHMVDFAKLMPVTYVVLLVMGLIGFTSLYLDIANPLRLF